VHGWKQTAAYWETIQFPDLNGDGRADVCGRAADGLYCGLSTGTSFTPSSFWTNNYSDVHGWMQDVAYWETIQFPDLNGDGKADVCGRAADGLFCGLSTGTSFTPSSFWTNNYSDVHGWKQTAAYWETIQFPDLNGDGRADVCGRAADGLYCGLSTGTSFTPSSFWTNNYSDVHGWMQDVAYWETIQFPDLNGDGKADVCGRAADGLFCGLSTGTSFTPSSFWTNNYSDVHGWKQTAAYWETIQFPDLNGDGKADVCGRAADGLYCGLSTGTSFTPSTYRTNNYSDTQGWIQDPAYWRTIQFPDLNGDGKADVCGRGASGVACNLPN
jgi:hypothetical protein